MQKTEKPIPWAFDTMAQCSSATGVPLAALRLAKKSGCDAFKHSRVDFAAFVRWWFQNQTTDMGVNWGEDLKKSQALRERIKLAEDEKKLYPREEVNRAWWIYFTACKFKLLNADNQIATWAQMKLGLTQVQGDAIREMIRRHVKSALTELNKKDFGQIECPQCKSPITTMIQP